jgi:hypothetical protein
MKEENIEIKSEEDVFEIDPVTGTKRYITKKKRHYPIPEGGAFPESIRKLWGDPSKTTIYPPEARGGQYYCGPFYVVSENGMILMSGMMN